MKLRSIQMAVLPAMLVLFIAVPLASLAADKAPMKNGPVMTAREAKALIATASTAKEHQRLARYFNQEAVHFEAEAQDHDEMIEAYRKNPTPWASKTPGGVRTIEHCESLAKSNREMAKVAHEMAAAHEEMAKEAK